MGALWHSKPTRRVRESLRFIGAGSFRPLSPPPTPETQRRSRRRAASGVQRKLSQQRPVGHGHLPNCPAGRTRRALPSHPSVNGSTTSPDFVLVSPESLPRVPTTASRTAADPLRSRRVVLARSPAPARAGEPRGVVASHPRHAIETIAYGDLSSNHQRPPMYPQIIRQKVVCISSHPGLNH